ncbi:MAG TPA: NAD(P)H-dependent oxidoreductase [Dysgonomonas sp.]|nr:NAD(P)H-dependent oxidoreductase [Dysgonomonas sp.]
MSLIDDLNWRYACKWMNGAKVDEEKLDIILETIRLAPTSIGMQLFKVIVVKKDEELKTIYEKAAPRQHMIPGCSHLLVFAAYTDFDEKDITDYTDRLGKARGTEGEELEFYKKKYIEYAATMDRESIPEWMAKQTYIVMAYATIAAAGLGIDCTPVEGFDPGAVDEILNLREKGLRSTLLLPLGYRDKDVDRSIGLAKVRKSKEDIFIFL